MLKPLAFVCVGSAVLGSQLLSRLDELGYRAEAISNAPDLPAQAQEAKPFVIVCDVSSAPMFELIKAIRKNPETSHIPVLGIARDTTAEFQAEATAAGATLVVIESGVLAQLPQLLAQAVAIDEIERRNKAPANTESKACLSHPLN